MLYFSFSVFTEGKVFLMNRKFLKPRSKGFIILRFQVFWDVMLCCWVSAQMD